MFVSIIITFYGWKYTGKHIIISFMTFNGIIYGIDNQCFSMIVKNN